MRKCKCGNQVASNARFCPKCGHRFTSGAIKVLAILFGVFGFFTFIVMIVVVSNSDSNVTPATQPAAAVNPVARGVKGMPTGNMASDTLSELPKREQASNLGKVAGEGCIGKRAFYMGSSSADRSAFWSVGCTDGKSYLVQIEADATGSTKVLDCGVYKLVTKMSCFTKLDN